MSDLYHLMRCFGERFIDVTEQEALYDIQYNRDELVGAYNALIKYAQWLADNE